MNSRIIAIALTFLCKITERIVKSRLTYHLSSNNLKPHQSVNIKHHSNETALLYIHHLITAISSQQIARLCFVELCVSAAFHNTGHNTLLFCSLGSEFMALF